MSDKYETDKPILELPHEIARIPADFREELIVRMCIATSVGLLMAQ